ncbi:MAG: hypothetical protein HYZ85_02725 [Candidatus Omnitrophica bacterium]|nr:hypothetical protein [Candidatus Omnitrophota bacterium]
MFPYRDANPSERLPIVTVSLIIINVLIFIQEVFMGESLEGFLMSFGVVPQKWLYVGQSPELSLSSLLFSYFSSMFLHAAGIILISILLPRKPSPTS